MPGWGLEVGCESKEAAVLQVQCSVPSPPLPSSPRPPQWVSQAVPLAPSSCALCSRGWGLCLDDSPSKDVIDFPSVPPGVLYDVGHQCRLQYGAHSAFCDDMDVSAGCSWGRGLPPQPAAPAGLGSSRTGCLADTMVCGSCYGQVAADAGPVSGWTLCGLWLLGKALSSQGRVIKGKTECTLHGPGGGRLR